MPTVIGTQEVSGRIPGNKWFNDLGMLQGKATGRAFDALMSYLTGGQFQRNSPFQAPPTPQFPGNLQFPSGATTPTSPAEIEAITRMGGVPTRDGRIIPYSQMGAKQGGVTYQAPKIDPRLLQAQAQQSQIAYQQAQIENQKTQHSLRQQELTNQKSYYDWLSGRAGQSTGNTPSTMPPQPSQSGLTPEQSTPEQQAFILNLYDRAERNDEEAILLLSSMGLI